MTTDNELDAVLRAVRERFIARTDASFDFAAGLADVYERAGLPGLSANDTGAASGTSDAGAADSDEAARRRRRQARQDDAKPRGRRAGGSD